MAVVECPTSRASARPRGALKKVSRLRCAIAATASMKRRGLNRGITEKRQNEAGMINNPETRRKRHLTPFAQGIMPGSARDTVAASNYRNR